MKKIQWLLAFALISLVSLAQAINLPSPVVSADWLANNMSEVQVIEVRTDLAWR